MAYDIKRIEAPHNLVMEGRQRLNLTGVEDVESFDEQSIVAVTTGGVLIIQGEALRIERLSLDVGELLVEGTISALAYEDEQKSSGGLFKRFFR